MKKLLLLLSVISVTAYFILDKEPMSPPERPIITVETHILDTKIGSMRRNGLADMEQRARDRNYDDNWVSYITAMASDRYRDDPGGVIIEYDHPDCPITIPAGRQVKFGHIGGFLNEIEHIFPLEPLSWDEMQVEKDRLIAMLDEAGWVRSVHHQAPSQGIHENITPADFARFPANVPKWVDIGNWEVCDNPYIKVHVQIRHYNSSSPGSFIPPAALSKPLNPFAEDRFLFLMRFKAEQYNLVENELTLLRNMRRIEVNGDPDKAIPLSVWLDDPDWRPEGWEGEFIK